MSQNKFSTSTGERVTKSVIDKRVHEAKALKIEQMLDEHGYIFCEEEDEDGNVCGKNTSAGDPIDCSHTISVKECQESGRSELAWAVSNIKMRCRTCHARRDKLNIQNGK